MCLGAHEGLSALCPVTRQGSRLHPQHKESSMRYLKRAAIVAAALGALTGLAAPAAMADPAPGYTDFAGCPEGRTDVVFCIRSSTPSGHIQLGTKDVPVTAPIVLSGGLLTDFDTVVYNSK